MSFTDHIPLDLGRIVGTRRSLGISAEQRRTHMHVIGSTGSGKSKFLEHCMRQDILEGRGLCLIDPHGELARNVLGWVSRLPVPPPRFHYIAPYRDDWTVCYNPLRRSTHDDWFLVNALKIAVVKCWGQDNTQDTPRLDEWLKTGFYTAVKLGLTLPEVGMLLEPNIERNIQRRAMIEKLPESATRMREAWEQLCLLAEKKRPIDFEATVGSTTRRLSAFLDNPRLNRIFGVPDVSLDLAGCMDEGAVILVDLSTQGRLHPEDAKLFGTLLLTDFYVQMFARREPQRPFTLYVDEFQNYATKDIARMLDEARKFGLQLVLSHQRPGQLQSADSAEERDLYSAVMTNARTKVVFGGISTDELEPIARMLSMGVLDPSRVKEKIHTRGVVDYKKEYWTSHSAGWSRSSGSGSARSRASGTSSGHVSSGGIATGTGPSHELFGPNALHVTESEAWADQYSSSEVLGESESEFSGESQSESETTFPVLVPILGEQLSAIYYMTLDEQLYQFMAVLTQQQQRQAMVRIVGQNEPVPIEVPFVREFDATEQDIEHQLQLMYAQTKCYLPVDTAEGRVLERQKGFLAMGAPEVMHRAAAPAHDKMEVPKPMEGEGKNNDVSLKVGNVMLQPRDIALLEDVFDSRFITIPHAAALHFSELTSAERTANRRLQAMAEVGLLKRDDGHFGFAALPDGRRKEIKALYRFTKGAFDVLVSRGLLPTEAGDEWESSMRKRFGNWTATTIDHEIGMLDIKAALKVAIERHAHLKVVEFGVWPRFYEFQVPKGGRIATQQPDGFVHVVEHRPGRDDVSHHYFYIEFDRGREQQDTLVEKAEGYKHHFKGGNFARSLGFPHAHRNEHPFRVLFVFDQKDSHARRDNIAERLSEAGIGTQTPLTTLGELVADPLGAIWITPRDGPAQKIALFEGLSTEDFGPRRSASA